MLIVEDEFLLRMDAAEAIGAAGFEVIEAANADEAIEVLEARPDITVVFTDIQMPGSMDGLKLARAVRGRWPPIKIIATSGHLHVSESGFARRRTVSAEALQPGTGHRRAARVDDRVLRTGRRTVISDAKTEAIISGVIWSSMKAMRSRNCSLRFFSRCSRSKSGAGD